jgi:membrane-associated phospholipid phosphatase
MANHLATEAASIAAPVDRIVGNPVHRLWAVYATISAIAVLFPYHPSTWPLLLAMHLLLAALLWPLPPFAQGWDFFTRRWPRALRIPFDWLPLLLVPLWYTELAPLNIMVHGGRYFDSIILAVEHAVFGMPSRDLAVHFPILWLSELLHGGYLSYYFIIFIPPAVLYLSGRPNAYRRALFTILLSFFMHYVFFIYFPVQGPRYLFPAPDGAIARGGLFRLTHKLLEAGSSRGAAFPSSHVGVSVTQSLIMMRFMPKGWPIIAVLTILLANGAVYGGFHYATDAFCGLVLGTIAVLIAPRMYRLLGGDWGTAA